ncbi:hypothetical protein MN186_11620 [Aliiroseovarius sp. N1F302]|uniref:hypothetical protein n=2 Tax=Aliiroseovarius TaxID=1658781 RepID=UPI001F593214|nr:hypothetical protein [Aliiroseovarius sediminis]MCI2395095.1 hypothetical protein [Aliiroseovarius sediminis]
MIERHVMSRKTQKRPVRTAATTLIAGLVLSSVFAVGAQAQDLIGSYTAYIGQPDLVDQTGARLTQPWQVLRQDRANFHRYGISQPGDEFDPFFGTIKNRKNMERMAKNGSIDATAAKRLMEGRGLVYVRIYGRGNTGTAINVTAAK